MAMSPCQLLIVSMVLKHFYCISSVFSDLTYMADEYIELSVIRYSTIYIYFVLNIYTNAVWMIMIEYIYVYILI